MHPAESTDIQGATQTGKPEFTEGDSRVPMNDAVPATFDDGSTTKTVDGVGTYTVAADGTVTFVPEKSFVGTAPAVTVVREDKNGTKASATYTPTVTLQYQLRHQLKQQNECSRCKSIWQTNLH
ncbi:MAG: hypothetical protein ACLU4Q_06030 [Streptococcus thermophilus]